MIKFWRKLTVAQRAQNDLELHKRSLYENENQVARSQANVNYNMAEIVRLNKIIEEQNGNRTA